jgi:hypothetical protein
MYELNHHFQDLWVAKLPWAKFVVNVDGKVTKVNGKFVVSWKGKIKFWCPSWILYGNMLVEGRPQLYLWVGQSGISIF